MADDRASLRRTSGLRTQTRPIFVNDATLYTVDHGIATITLNRPDNRNAMSVELLNSLGDNLEQAIADDTVRLVVLTNEGNTFCAGADLKGGSTEQPRHTLVTI